MKKILVMLLVLGLALGAVACAGTPAATTGAAPEVTDAPATEAPTDAPTEAPVEETEAPVEETEAPATEAAVEETEAPAVEGGVEAEISVQVEEAWEGYYDEAIARVLEKNPDAVINKIVIGSFDHFDILSSTDATNPDFADVFAMPADRLAGLHKNDVLAAIDSQRMAATVGGFDDYDAGLGGNFMIEGEYFAFPMNIETLILFGNKANLEASEIVLDAPIELIGNEEKVLLPLFDAWFGVAATNSSDIELLGKDENGELYSDMTLAWEDLPAEKQATIEALYEYWKYNNEANTSLFDADSGWGYIDEEFKSEGGSIIRLGGPWETGSNTELAGEGNVDVFPISMLTVAEKPLRHWKGGWGLAINARVEENEDQMELAHQLIEEIMNTEYAVDFFRSAGKIMENVPVDVYLASDLSDSDKAVISAVIASYAEAPLRPLFEEWGQVWDTYKNGILSWNNVKPESVEDAYNELKSSFEAMMGNF